MQGVNMRVVLLSGYGDYIGLEYLKIFFKENISISAIVFQGDTHNLKHAKIASERTKGKYKKPFIGDVLNRKDTKLFFVEKHNSEKSRLILKELKPDIMVLAGTDIIEPKILGMARLGVLNTHPGLLPNYRGCSCVEWAIYNDDPIAATCHIAGAKVDLGPEVYKEVMSVYSGDDYPDIRVRMIYHQAKVMLIGLKKYMADPRSWKDSPRKGRYYKPIDAAKLAQVIDKIKNKTYACMEETQA